MSTPALDPRMDTSKDFADGARYEAQIREEARVRTGHGELLDFMDRLSAAIPWETDHGLLLLAAYVYDPAVDEDSKERARRTSQVCATGSVHGRHRR